MSIEETNELDDQFLRQHYRQPRPAFAAELRERLAAEAPPAPRPPLLRRLALSAVGLGLLLFALLSSFPAARAEAMALLRLIGGVSVEEVAENPPVTPTEVVQVSPQLPWAEAQARLGVALPTAVPTEYVLQEQASLLEDPEFTTASFFWLGPAGSLQLNISRSPQPQPFTQRIGPGSAEELQVAGAPAALVRGAWDGATWRDDGTLALSWRRGDDLYEIIAFNTVDGAQPLGVEGLVQMAESIP